MYDRGFSDNFSSFYKQLLVCPEMRNIKKSIVKCKQSRPPAAFASITVRN